MLAGIGCRPCRGFRNPTRPYSPTAVAVGHMISALTGLQTLVVRRGCAWQESLSPGPLESGILNFALQLRRKSKGGQRAGRPQTEWTDFVIF